MPDYPRILAGYRLPNPPGGHVLDMQRSFAQYSWYAKTSLGWFWLDELKANPEWQFLPNGPLYDRGEE